MNASAQPSIHRSIWKKKPALRAVYKDYYNIIQQWQTDGRTLEIGAGPGNAEHIGPDMVLTDISFAPWLDITCDAQALPFRDGTFSNIVMVDVLHHISRPAHFLTEAERVLKTGGRLLVLEPGITPISYIVYKFFHTEDVDLSTDPLDMSRPTTKDPYEGNQAIATRLFGREKHRISMITPKMKLIRKTWVSLFAYPLSGGFKPWSLLPSFMVSKILFFERLILPIFGPIGAFRLFVVLEKNGDT